MNLWGLFRGRKAKAHKALDRVDRRQDQAEDELVKIEQDWQEQKPRNDPVLAEAERVQRLIMERSGHAGSR